MTDKKGFTSSIVHHDRLQRFANGPVHAPIYNSVLYNHEKTQDLVDIFQGTKAGYSYSRQAAPTSDSLQHLVNKAEQGVGSLVFATGMAAISSVFLTLLKAGDHLIASQYLFGNTHSLLQTIQGLGIEVSLVDTCDIASVVAAKQENTRMVFTETIANPGTQIADLAAIGDWCADSGLVYFVDNTLTSPYLFRPKNVKASLVMNSLSKFFCGHGTVLGGSITDTGEFDWQDYPNIFSAYRKGDSAKWALMQIKKKYLRDMGGSLSPDAAYQIAIGAETMALRMDRSNASALALAKMLDAHPKVKHVYYPGLSNHPQHDIASQLFQKYGSLVSFDLVDGSDCISFLDSIALVLNATHLGDNRTLALPMASTIFYEMGAQNRAAIGIGDTMIRCSVGIEETDDLLSEFSAALELL